MIEVVFLLFILIVSYIAGINEEDYWDGLSRDTRYLHRLKIMNELGSTEDGGVEV